MSSRKALAFSFLDRYSGLLLSVGASMVIARLLTPAEIGVFSVATVLLSFISAIRDFGADQYLVQEKELTTERIRATWTIQLGLGVGFALIALVAAIPVSRFYAEPRLRDILFCLALNFAISPFGSLTYAWLMREMRFDSLAIMRFTGSVTGALVSVGLAWAGHGPISLAFGSLAATVANSIIATLLRPKSFPWLPGRKELKRVVTFGGHVSLTTIMTTVAYGVPELVLGKLHGMTPVGLYSRASGLGGMFQRLLLDAVQSVALSMFSKAVREGRGVAELFVRATSYVTAIGWSFFGGLIVPAGSIVHVLYGDQWDAAVPLVRLIALALAILLPSMLCSTLLMASGATALLVRVTLLDMLVYMLLLGIGAAFGLAAAGWALVVVAAGRLAIWMLMTPMVRQISKAEWLDLCLRSGAVATAASVASGVAFASMPDGSSHLLRLAVDIVAGTLAFVAALFVCKHPLREEVVRFRATLSGRLFRARKA